jgi:hypothetical protein
MANLTTEQALELARAETRTLSDQLRQARAELHRMGIADQNRALVCAAVSGRRSSGRWWSAKIQPVYEIVPILASASARIRNESRFCHMNNWDFGNAEWYFHCPKK